MSRDYIDDIKDMSAALDAVISDEGFDQLDPKTRVKVYEAANKVKVA